MILITAATGQYGRLVVDAEDGCRHDALGGTGWEGGPQTSVQDIIPSLSALGYPAGPADKPDFRVMTGGLSS